MQQEISEYLNDNGYEIVDYKNNLAKKKDDNKNQIKIGKILTFLSKTDEKAGELLNKMNTSTARAGVKSSQIIVISKAPYDIGGASTDRGWTSCMNLRRGSNRRYIDFDIKQGSLVSYLIKSDDLNIKNPMARVFIKPYISISGDDFLYGVENKDIKYGSAPSNYMITLLKILDEAQGEKTGRFKLDDELYPDGEDTIKKLRKNASTEEKLSYYGIKIYTINQDGTIDVDGDVNISDENLTEMPFKFGKVKGYFDCSKNELTSLEGAPKYVEEYFDCSNNELTSLEGVSKFIGGRFNCEENALTSLEGAPKRVGSDFICSYNRLKSLENAPEYVGMNFICSGNQLTSLKGAPKSVGYHFVCSNNELTSLEGAPEYIRGGFNCSNNELTSLAGAPKNVDGPFYCYDNRKKFTEDDVRAVTKVESYIFK